MEEDKSSFDSFELIVSTDIKAYLKDTANWTMFLAILGFLGLGYMLLECIAAFSLNAKYNEIKSYGLTYNYLGIIYIVMAVAYAFPIYYLFNFSRKLRNAINLNNNEAFKVAFYNLKLHFKYMGIAVIAIILLYFILIGGTIFYLRN